MKTYSRLSAPDLTHQLEATRVLTVDAQNAAITHPAPRGLFICQVGAFIESSAFDLDCGSTWYILSLHVAVDLPPLRILGWRLVLPWEDPQFQWLTDPLEYASRGSGYPDPGRRGLKYPRDQVINHRKVVQRGHCLDGWLLGLGYEPIPDSYPHGATIYANLVLVDEIGRDFSTPVQLWVDRSAKIDRPRKKKTTRWRLFEKRDVAKGELIQK
jgi:hypothetical protein